MAVLPKVKFSKIDEEMQVLISELNRLGLKTTACCAGHGKKVSYVAFDTSDVDVYISDGHLAIYWMPARQN